MGVIKRAALYSNHLDIQQAIELYETVVRGNDTLAVKFFGFATPHGFGVGKWVPAAKAKELPGEHAVLMDGQATSFTLSICEDPRQLQDQPVSWSWSSDVNHAIIIDSQRREFFVRRWDYPLARRFSLPAEAGHAREIVRILKESGTLRVLDVISHVLRAFRQVRLALRNQKPIEAVKVFLGLLVAAERVKICALPASEIVSIKTIGDLFQTIRNSGSADDEFTQIESATKKVQVGTLLSDFLQRHPLTGCTLEPGLLLRHAAGRLFQEANLIVERAEEQSYFAGLAPEKKPVGKLDRDVRFTPPTLARALAEHALDTVNRVPKSFSVLDPACGSGVFLTLSPPIRWERRGDSKLAPSVILTAISSHRFRGSIAGFGLVSL